MSAFLRHLQEKLACAKKTITASPVVRQHAKGFYPLFLLSLVVGCSPNSESSHALGQGPAVRGETVQRGDITQATATDYSLCDNADTAYAHPAEVEVLMLDSKANTKHLNEKIASLINLEEIYLFDNRTLDFETFFKEMRHLKKLHKMQLLNCQIQVTGNLKQLLTLKTLVLKNNGLKTVPLELIAALALDELIIVEDRFAFTGKMSSRSSLKSLDISGNRERHLNPELYKLKQLTQLTLFGSDLKYISPRITQLPSLRKLTVLACPLSSDSKELITLREVLPSKCELVTDENYKSSHQ
jgi:Leucine-rich repeat (LRR) protein